MPKIRVLVVDDAVVMRRMISEVLSRDPDLEVVGAAANGRIALQKIEQVNPDVLTLDVEMPVMDGLETIRELRKSYKNLPVIMFSTVTLRGAGITLEALAAGANDYVTKPANVGSVTEGMERLRTELIPLIKTHCRSVLPGVDSRGGPVLPKSSSIDSGGISRKEPSAAPSLLCIGSSTGGPNALAEFFSSIPAPLSAPCVIVQHMPPLFTQMLAERLGKISPLRFYEGQDGQPLEPGCVYIAPGGRHMEVRRHGSSARLLLQDGPPENSCRPAVDVLFRSVAAAYPGTAMALILTGMGQDGLRGCEVIRERGGFIVAQDEESSVVWGMPGQVVRAQLADKVLPISEMAGEVLRQFSKRPITVSQTV